MAYKRNRYGSIVLTDEAGNNFTITKKEQEQIKRLVKNANQRRLDKTKAYYEDVKGQRNMRGISKKAFMDLLDTKNFITEKYSSAFSQFADKDDVKDFIKELKTVTKRGYGNKRIDEIRESMNKRLVETYGEEDTKKIRDRIKGLTNGELLTVYLHNDEIVKAIYGSDIDDDQMVALLSKTESDIEFYLSCWNKKNDVKPKKRKAKRRK